VTELQEITGGKDGAPLYLRFLRGPVSRTEAFAGGEVNVDFDSDNRVTGIEMLSADPEEVEAVAKIATAHQLSIASIFSGDAKRV
jgi:uncharacterized protein YuzE